MKPTFCKYFIALILFFSFSEINAQVCNGTLGDPVINIDFGKGANAFGSPLTFGTTNYNFVGGTPNDGDYTISQNTFGMHSSGNGWFQINNHTPNDANGYMMVVNASNNPGIFYQTTITGLCPGTTYEFAAWIINILNYSGIKPNVTFQIETISGTVLKSYDTGDILENTTATWKQYATTFTTSSNADIVLKMINNGPGGNGNDIALDDITFRACGPTITPSINNVVGVNADLCVGQSKTYNLAAQVSAGYSDPVYQWQSFNGSTWIDILGENTTQTTVTFTNAVVGTYKYRLSVAERPNINSVNCRTSSAILTIHVNEKPNPIASNSGAACVGSVIQLNVDQGISFSWTGPNGFTSLFQNPIIPNVSANSSGIYTVTVFNASGCSNTSQTQVQVLPQVIAYTNITTATICENESFELEASGGSSYTWLPTDGLSNPNSATPIATPKQTTIYTVKVSNGTCFTTKQILITVLKNASANAGGDKKLFLGQSVTLKGNATGDNITYLWSPIDYLDDPTKLNPIATPPNDITYTLTVNSNCNVSTDDVFVKVYPKIEIPNTFTPNGDGINDTWNIPSIAAFTNPKLKVVNRNGQLVFESSNPQPWMENLTVKICQ